MRKIMQRLHTNFSKKMKWTSGELEVKELLQSELPLHTSTVEDALQFLSHNNLKYYKETNIQDIDFGVEVPIDYFLAFSGQGPIIWKNFLPSGHAYTILLGFGDKDILVSTKVGMMELHI